MKKLIVLIALSFLFVGCGEAVSSPATPDTQTPSAQLATPTPQATEKPTVKPVIPTPKPVTPTPVSPGSKPPVVPGLGSADGPQLGSPLSLFVKTFGPSPDNIWGIGGNDVSLAVDTTGSKVTYILITTDDKVTWSKDQNTMIAFCSQFMPPDVREINQRQSPEFLSVNYTSSIGDFYMLISHLGGPGTWSCVMETGSN